MAPPAPRVSAFWADFFDVPVEALDEPGVRVVAHAGLGDYSGAWFFVRGGACIVSAPPRWLQPLRDALHDRSLDAVLSEVGLAMVFGEALAGTVGPVFHGYLDPARFRPYPARAVRAIGRSDGRAVLALREACGEDAWQDGSVSSDPPGAFGWFEYGTLLAAASLTDWGANTVGPGVIVHPDRRRAGCGKAVVSAAVTWALAADKLLTYQTLIENQAAVGIARNLGFEQFASHIAVRLR